MFFSQRAKNLCLAGLGGIVLFLVLLLGCTSEPTQPPTPISPLPTPTPFYDAPVSIMDKAISGTTFIYWNTAPITSYVHLVYTDSAYAESWFLYVDLELWQDGRVVMTQTIDTGIRPVDDLGEGLFAVVTWTWPISITGYAEEYQRTRWASRLTNEEYIGYVVTKDNEVVERDERGFSLWGQVQGSNFLLFMPLIARQEQVP